LLHRLPGTQLRPDAHNLDALDAMPLVGGVVALTTAQVFQTLATEGAHRVFRAAGFLLESTHGTDPESRIGRRGDF
jgi:hypothetical protein